jgi:diacylglycerol kinase family enzyme
MAGKRLANILFVINPISGDIEKAEVVAEIETFCFEEKIHATFFNTSGDNDLLRLKEELKTLRYDAVVAVGGDGTVHLAGAALVNSGLPLGILPMGSGNGLSKDTGIPQELSEALKVLTDYTIKAIDTLSVNNEICVHITDLGFNALVVKLFSEGESRGPTSYAFVAMQQYLNFEPHKYKVETDNGNFTGEAFMVTVTNANAFGSNAAINPSGIIDDGKFEICIIEPFPKTSALQILYRLYNDSIEASDYSQLISCRQATIYNLEQDVSHVDGEPVELGEKISIKINPKSLNLMLPNLQSITEKEATA